MDFDETLAEWRRQMIAEAKAEAARETQTLAAAVEQQLVDLGFDPTFDTVPERGFPRDLTRYEDAVRSAINNSSPFQWRPW